VPVGFGRRSTVLLGVLGATTACSTARIPFECAGDDECVTDEATGRCERTGYCSFPDAACESGWGYADLAAGDLAAECVAQCILGLSLGAQHSCALLRGGAIACWGDGRAGQLGDGELHPDPVPSPVMVDASLPPAVAVTVGGGHGCALAAENGSVWCWGSDKSLQLGEPEAGPAPVRVAALDGAGTPMTQIAAGLAHTCARASVGVGCWGNNEHGQLGNGKVGGSSGPALVAFKNGFVQVATGDAHSCGFTLAGTVHCWGDNDALQAGASEHEPALPEPVMVKTPLRASGLELGLTHSCLVSSDQDRPVACWGNNSLFGQLGRPASVKESALPLPLDLGVETTAVAAGGTHSCALTEDGRAWCWGGNAYGQQGPEQSAGATFAPEPAVVELVGKIVEIAAGALHTCARTDRDVVYCFGANEYGQLGNGKVDPAGQSEPDPTVTAALTCR
jgi:alpha-tubulin suppressor-like RCC1 family protein